MLNKCKQCRLSTGEILMVETVVLLGYILLVAKDNGGWGPYFNGPLTILPTFVSLSGILSLPPNSDFQILFISLPSPPSVPYFPSHSKMATRWHHCLSQTCGKECPHLFYLFRKAQKSNYYLLNLHFPTWEPPDPCGCWALEIGGVEAGMCCECDQHIQFQGLNMREKRM